MLILFKNVLIHYRYNTSKTPYNKKSKSYISFMKRDIFIICPEYQSTFSQGDNTRL